MAEKIPRRLKRFYRNGDSVPSGENKIELDEVSYGKREENTKEDKNEIAKELALDEVALFKEKHNRLPKKEEYDSISESIYMQLKDKEQRKKAMERIERKRGRKSKETKEVEKKKRHLRHGRREREEALQTEPAEGAEPVESSQVLAGETVAAEVKGLNFEDLFSDGKKKEKKSIGELEGIAGEDEFNLEGLEGMGETKSAQKKCPKCGNPTEEVIFCPECGTAFCEKCAKKVEVEAKGKSFVCPNCGKKVKK